MQEIYPRSPLLITFQVNRLLSPTYVTAVIELLSSAILLVTRITVGIAAHMQVRKSLFLTLQLKGN
jgi:hypothetical protein